MCEPTTAMLAIMAVTTAVSLKQQSDAAKASERNYRAAQEEEAKQIYASKSIAAQDRALKARKERSRLRAIAAESGLSGISTTDLFDNVNFAASRDMARIDMQGQWDQTNSIYQLQSNLNNINQPDYAGAAGNLALNAYGLGAFGGVGSPTAPTPTQGTGPSGPPV